MHLLVSTRLQCSPGPLLVTSGAARRWSLGLLIGGGLACLCCSSVLADLRYDVEITGVEDSSLADLLDDVSELKSLEDRLPASEEALRRRADYGRDVLSKGSSASKTRFSREVQMAAIGASCPLPCVPAEVS